MRKITIILIMISWSFVSFSQDESGEIHGDFNLSLQSYQEDLLIDAKAAEEVVLNNAFLNINYIYISFFIKY